MGNLARAQAAAGTVSEGAKSAQAALLHIFAAHYTQNPEDMSPGWSKP
jgi:hypothetical protein